MDITAETIQKILDIGSTSVEKFGDRIFSTRPLFNLPRPDEPVYPTIDLATLDGLLEFVARNQANMIGGQIIVKATEVQYAGAPFGVNLQRNIYARVKCNVAPFSFGLFQDLEIFRIALLTRFIESPARQGILDFTAKLNDEATKSLTDNGIAQTVNVKVGLASFGTVDVPSPAYLQPIRTFTEIEQPVGTFVLRLRKGAHGPEAALFEIFTDWERNAVESLRDWLLKKPVAAGIPIYA